MSNKLAKGKAKKQNKNKTDFSARCDWLIRPRDDNVSVMV